MSRRTISAYYSGLPHQTQRWETRSARLHTRLPLRHHLQALETSNKADEGGSPETYTLVALGVEKHKAQMAETRSKITYITPLMLCVIFIR